VSDQDAASIAQAMQCIDMMIVSKSSSAALMKVNGIPGLAFPSKIKYR
jgi:hypothetical protein